MNTRAQRGGLLRHPLNDVVDLESVASAMELDRPGADLVWLDSGASAHDGRSLLAWGVRVPLDGDAPVLPRLRAALVALPSVESADTGDVVPLGLVGWFGYELAAETMGMPVADAPAHHRASWLAVDRAVLVDHRSGTAELVALDHEDAGTWSAELDEWRQRMLVLIAGAGRASRPDVETAGLGSEPVAWRDHDAHYAHLVRRCQEAIREGEAYQLCLTTQVTVPGQHDPLSLHTRLRRASPAHHGALLRIGGTTLVSASPETFLRVEYNADSVIVSTRPIKGTRPRGSDAPGDAALAAELAASSKEQAENLMIVDLMRNDLSRVSELGSVAVTGLLEVESYAQVHQLVSTIEGRLRPGLDAIDVVSACFPAGSMTGAPKRRAIELLAAFENAPRGIYSGCFGYLAADGAADLAMVIRSVVIEQGVATVGAGGGVTALSDPHAEVEEMHLKAAALLDALAAPAAPAALGAFGALGALAAFPAG